MVGMNSPTTVGAPTGVGPSPALTGAPTGSGFAATPPVQPTRSPGAWKGWVVLIATVLIVAGAVAYVSFGGSGPKPKVLLKSGTGIEIPAGEYFAVPVSVSKSATLSGSLDSGDGVAVYLMNPSTYNVFHGSGRTAGSQWSSGVVHNGSFEVFFGSGSWEVVFEATDPSLPTEFIATSDLTVTTST
jgi:hypothetical protein